MQKDIIAVIAENLDTIINVYKMSKDKDRNEIEEDIRKAILGMKDTK